MTVPTTISKAGPYAGAGTVGPFPIPFRFLESSHLSVVATDPSGANSTLVLDTDYTVTGAGADSGSVRLTAPLFAGWRLVVLRNVPATQEADYVQNDAFPAESHEQALDKLTMLVQQQGEALGRALTVPPTDPRVSLVLPPANARAKRYLSFDDLGRPIATTFDVEAVAQASQAAQDAAAAAKQSETNAADSAADAQGSADFARQQSEFVAKQVGATTPTVVRFSGDGVATSFELPSVPGAEENTLVYISGVYQQKNTYDIPAGTSSLIFSEAPPFGAENIEVVIAPSVMLSIADAQDVSFVGPDGIKRNLGSYLREGVSKAVFSFPTLALAQAAAATLPDGQIVEIEADESKGGARTRYRVNGATLDFVVNLDQLRIDLAQPDGVALVGGAASEVEIRKSITMFGAKADGSDSKAALLAAMPYVHFPLLDAQPTTYTFSSFAEGQLNGAVFSADEGVTLSFADNAPYAIYAGITASTPISMFARDISMPYVMLPGNRRSAGGNDTVVLRPSAVRQIGNLQPLNGADVSFLGVTWPGSDTWSAITGVTASEFTASFPAGGASDRFRGAFVALGPYETVAATHTATAGTVRGVVIRGANGFAVMFSAGGSSNYVMGVKLTGQASQETQVQWEFLGQGLYSSFASENSRYSVTRVGSGQAVVKVNGKAITTPFLSDVGEIDSVGFVVYGAGAFSVSDMTIQNSVEAVYSKTVIAGIRIFGDSTAADFPGAFGSYLRGLLDGVYGVAVQDVTNFAVVGHSTAQQSALMDTVGFGLSPYVVLCMGTNDIQGQTGLNDFRAVYTAAIQKVVTAGRRPVVVVPWMWYTRAQSGGLGQASANYEKGAPYRGVIEAIARKYGAILVNTPEVLPNPDPRLVTQSSDYSLLRDNIHQGARGYQLYASAIAQAILDDYCSTDKSVLVRRVQFGVNASSSDFQLSVGADGVVNFGGTIQFSATPGSGVVAFNLPRWCRPPVSFNIPVSASIAGSSPSSSYAFVQASGTVSLPAVPAGTTTFIFSGAFKLAQ